MLKLSVLWVVGLGILGGLVARETAEGRALAEIAQVSDTNFYILKEGEYHSSIYDPVSDGYLYYAGSVTATEAMARAGYPLHDSRKYYGNDISAELYWTWIYGHGRILKYSVTGID